MTSQQRIDNYNKECGFPTSLFIAGDGRIVGTWVMGNNYTTKQNFYGSYPYGYLNRIKLLFSDKKNTLHLFSGCVDTELFPGKTVDINSDQKPDYVDDAHTLEHVPLEDFDLILADPPYSVEDCDHYKTTMIKRNVVLRNLGERLKSGAHIVWLDQVLPMYKKVKLKTIGYIGMVKSTNHRFRVITIFEKL